MMKIAKLIDKISQKKYIKFIYLGFFSSMFLIKNPIFGEGKFKEITNGVKLLDSNFYNSYSDILNFFSSIGVHGLRSYSIVLLLDFIVIITFLLFNSTLILRLVSNVNNEKKYQLLLLLPFAKGIFDFFENMSLILSINLSKASFLIRIAQISTPIKWIFFALTITLLIALTFVVLYNKIKRHKGIESLNNNKKSLKFLAINGSHKKSGGVNQLFIDSIFKGALKKGAEVETVRLSTIKINHCISCNKCQKSNEYMCVFDDKDDFKHIYNKILDADVILYATPIYILNVSGLMKTFLDRFYSRGKSKKNIITKSNLLFHDVEKKILNKKIISVIVSDNIESKTTKSTICFFKNLASFFDYTYIGSFIRSGSYIFKDEVKDNYKKQINEIVNNLEKAGEIFASNETLPKRIEKMVNKRLIPIPIPVFNVLKKSNIGRQKLLQKINGVR